MRVLVIGAGAGGAAATAELTRAGHEVALWNRSAATLEPFQRRGGVGYEGVLGSGMAVPGLITADLGEAVKGADGALVTLPTFSHAAVARALAEAGWPADRPVVLNPGHTGGALEFHTAYAAAAGAVPPVAEFSTLTYVARKLEPDTVTVSGRANSVRVACLPGGDAALEMARILFSSADPVADVLFADLANVNMVLHPPGAILGAAWVEATGGDFTFYVQGMTPGVARVMADLDGERRALGAALGHDMPNLIDEMRRIGTVEDDGTPSDDFAAAISGGVANSRIKAPDSLQHRYYLEDFGHGLVPFLAIARIADVETPVAAALLRLASSLTGRDFHQDGRTAAAMGIEGLDRAGLIKRVRQG